MSQKLPYECFPAKISRSFEFFDFRLTETFYTPNPKLPHHTHSRDILVYVLQGSFTETFQGKPRLFTQSTGLFRPAGELHSNLFHERGGRCFNVEVSPTLLERLREHGLSLSNLVELYKKTHR